MRKRIVIFLWISLVCLIIAFACLVIYQNKMEADRLEELRIERERQEAQKKLELEYDETEIVEDAQDTVEDFEANYYAQSQAVVREEPYPTSEIIGTLKLDQVVTIVGKVTGADFYKIKINGDYGYIAFDDVSETYLDVPLPTSGNKAIPSATKDILFIGNSITFYPHTDDWWGSAWGCGATSIDSDYVHLTVAAKGYSSFDYMSMRSWEFANTRNNELTDLDPYITNYQYGTIVIELGENVKGHENHFKEDLTDMIKYIRTYNPNARIVMLDNFWKFSSIINTKKEVAAETGCTFVSLADIQGNKEYQWNEGDQYTFIDGTEYTINSFIAGHPNDAGFAAIAERLIAAL